MNTSEQLKRLSELGLVVLENHSLGDHSEKWYCSFDENKTLGEKRFHIGAFSDNPSDAVSEIWLGVAGHYQISEVGLMTKST